MAKEIVSHTSISFFSLVVTLTRGPQMTSIDVMENDPAFGLRMASDSLPFFTQLELREVEQSIHLKSTTLNI